MANPHGFKAQNCKLGFYVDPGGYESRSKTSHGTAHTAQPRDSPTAALNHVSEPRVRRDDRDGADVNRTAHRLKIGIGKRFKGQS